MKYEFNYIYKITNSETKEYYYGAHQTNNMNDGYMGSSSILKRNSDKNGFTKEILSYHNTSEEMYIAEKDIITKEVRKDPKCYNVISGGGGGNSNFKSDTREKIAKTLSGRTKEKYEYLRKHSDRMKLKTKENNSGTAEMARKLKGRTKETHNHVARTSKALTGRTKSSHQNILSTSMLNQKGIYTTPFGNFLSIKYAAQVGKTSNSNIQNLCKYKNNLKILRKTSLVNSIQLIRESEGKTPNELGFDFIEFPNKYKSFEDREEFCFENNVSFDY